MIAFVFTFYVLSFFFDLRPAARTKEEVRLDMQDAGQDMQETRRTGGASEDGIAPASRG